MSKLRLALAGILSEFGRCSGLGLVARMNGAGGMMKSVGRRPGLKTGSVEGIRDS